MEEMAPSHQTIYPTTQDNKTNGIFQPDSKARVGRAAATKPMEWESVTEASVSSVRWARVHAYYVPFPGSGLVLRK